MHSTRSMSAAPRILHPVPTGDGRSFWSRIFSWRPVQPPPAAASRRRETPRTPPRPSLAKLDDAVSEAMLTSAVEASLQIDFAAPPVVPLLTDEEEALATRVVEQFKASPPLLEAFPQLAMRVLQVVAEPNVTYRQLGALIGRDPAMSAEVIRISNSAAYHGVREIQSVNDAIGRVGLQEVARIVGIVASRSLFDARIASERKLFGNLAAHFRLQAIVTAIAASGLSLEFREGHSDRAFTGGLLHDIGKSLALRSLAGLVLDEGLELSVGDPKLLRVVERVHVELGMMAHELWKLPPCLRLLAERHHQRGADVEVSLGRVDFHAVRLVSGLILFRSAPEQQPLAAQEVLESAHALKLTPERFRVLDAERKHAEEKARLLLGVES